MGWFGCNPSTSAGDRAFNMCAICSHHYKVSGNLISYKSNRNWISSTAPWISWSIHSFSIITHGQEASTWSFPCPLELSLPHRTQAPSLSLVIVIKTRLATLGVGGPTLSHHLAIATSVGPTSLSITNILSMTNGRSFTIPIKELQVPIRSVASSLEMTLSLHLHPFFSRHRS